MDGQILSPQFVIRLKDGRYWIRTDTFTGHLDAATKYDSRWIALQEMSKAGAIMHQAAIVPYQRPSERAAKPVTDWPQKKDL